MSVSLSKLLREIRNWRGTPRKRVQELYVRQNANAEYSVRLSNRDNTRLHKSIQKGYDYYLNIPQALRED